MTKSLSEVLKNVYLSYQVIPSPNFPAAVTPLLDQRPPFFSDKIEQEEDTTTTPTLTRRSPQVSMDEDAMLLGLQRQDTDPAEVTLADIQSRSYLYWNDSDSQEATEG